jgi:hypothetical protein
MEEDQDMGQALIEIFNSRGQFVLPSPEAIAGLDNATRDRFTAVQGAAQAAEAAVAATKQAQRHVTECMEAVRVADDELRKARPPVSAVDAARAWIVSQQRE